MIIFYIVSLPVAIWLWLGIAFTTLDYILYRDNQEGIPHDRSTRPAEAYQV